MTAINLQLPDGAKPRVLGANRRTAAPASAPVPAPAPYVLNKPLVGRPATLTMPMVSGLGDRATDNDGATPENLTSITFDQVRDLVDRPQQGLEKSHAQWLIPSTLMARKLYRQQAEGQYVALWGDLDEPTTTIKQTAEIIRSIVGGCDFEVYATRSATRDVQKCRILIPLHEPLTPAEWVLCAEVFNRKMAAAGLVPDRKSEVLSQIMYLPNKGEFYDCRVARGGELFKPLVVWAGDIAAREAEIARQREVEQSKREAAKRRKEELARQRGQTHQDPIDAFNDNYDPSEFMLNRGYAERGDKYRHPASQTGNFSASIVVGRDGKRRVHSLSSADPLYTGGGGVGAHDAFSTYCVLEHGGNTEKHRKDALKAACDKLLFIDGKPWNEVKQQEWAEQRRQERQRQQLGSAGFDIPLPDVADTPTNGLQGQQGAAQADEDGVIHEPLDPFEEHPVPTFPLHVLPDVFRDYAEACSRGSGFEAGTYGFSLLTLAAGMIDHRVTLQAGPLRVPPHIWGSLSGSSGAGKSPIINACARAIRKIDEEMQRESVREIQEWMKLDKEEQKKTPQPPMRQLVLSNTTTEAAANVLNHNPEGPILILPELSEWVGRMDAYSAGGDKDRAVWIQAYDGGTQTINRAKSPVPMLLENFSAGMLAGIQPEKLAQMFAKSAAGGADGLFQRFLTYQIPMAGPVDYSYRMNEFLECNVANVFRKLHDWREGRTLKGFRLASDAIPEAEAHHNTLRKLAQRLPNGRFAEHVDKLAGLTLRVSFALHVMHAAAQGVLPSADVPLEMFQRAQDVMRVLYRHSEAAYAQLDQTGIGNSIKLAKSACEAVLVKKWKMFQHGDLTRYATHWEGADDRHREAAIDLLIDWSWITDVTPAQQPGKRGRRSQGVFAVNPLVGQRFQPHADRIKFEREERYAAIQKLAAVRRGE